MEKLHTALTQFLLAEGTQNEAQAQSRLFDACLDAGMSMDEPCITTWACKTCAQDLQARGLLNELAA